MHSSEDFFLSGRSLPSWVTGLAFVGANLGALEILGMGANAAQYGILQAHFYWIGAIPVMIFVAIFNAPLLATFLLGMFWRRTTPWGGFFYSFDISHSHILLTHN